MRDHPYVLPVEPVSEAERVAWMLRPRDEHDVDVDPASFRGQWLDLVDDSVRRWAQVPAWLRVVAWVSFVGRSLLSRLAALVRRGR